MEYNVIPKVNFLDLANRKVRVLLVYNISVDVEKEVLPRLSMHVHAAMQLQYTLYILCLNLQH